MSARGDARKRDAVERITPTWPAYDEHADILAELAETQAALHAATNDVGRLAAELHTAHGQIDRVRKVAQEWGSSPLSDVLLAALDGGAS